VLVCKITDPTELDVLADEEPTDVKVLAEVEPARGEDWVSTELRDTALSDAEELTDSEV
jgi:hypothetical protein